MHSNKKMNKASSSTCLTSVFSSVKQGLKTASTLKLNMVVRQMGSYQGCHFIRVPIYKKNKKTLIFNQTFFKENIMGYVCRRVRGKWDLQGTCMVTTITLNCLLKWMSLVIQLYFATVRFASWTRVEML